MERHSWKILSSTVSVSSGFSRKVVTMKWIMRGRQPESRDSRAQRTTHAAFPLAIHEDSQRQPGQFDQSLSDSSGSIPQGFGGG